MNPNTQPNGFISNGYYGGIPMGPSGGTGTNKKRPTTANRKNGNIPMAFGMQKKSFPSKTPSSIDLEVSKLRPKHIN